MTGAPLLSVRGLSIALPLPDGGSRPLVSDVSFDLRPGASLGIVGESGSGKTLTALAVIGLVPDGLTVEGEIRFEATDMVCAPERQRDEVRGAGIGMVFQEPSAALDPAMRIGGQIAEALRISGRRPRAEERERVIDLLAAVRLDDPAARAGAFPHELSGGQRQRAAIAIALARRPRLLLADEPTTALDATVRGEILDLLAELTAREGMALILVSHDLAAVARTCTDLLVLYAGTRFEAGAAAEVLAGPVNPYTRALLSAVPRPRPREAGRRARLTAIPGAVPRPGALPPGCRFAPRCAFRTDACDAGEPTWRRVVADRGVRCIRVDAQTGEIR